MSDWHPHPAARIGLPLLGLGLIASLGSQGRLLHHLVDRSAGITLAQFAVAVTAFLSASLGMTLLLLGPDLWKPVRVAPRWTRRDAPMLGSRKRS